VTAVVGMVVLVLLLVVVVVVVVVVAHPFDCIRLDQVFVGIFGVAIS